LIDDRAYPVSRLGFSSVTTLFSSPRQLSVWLMIILILTATWLRLWRLPDIPPAFNYDEAYNAVDTLWLRETNSTIVYLPGNTGRQALYHHLAGLFMAMLGINVFALRFVSVVIGILVVPLMYRWVVTMFAGEAQRYALGLLASAGLAFSFWHIAISRSGFRASLLHLLFILMAYFFWKGWQRQSSWYIAGAGVALGLGQYTYWLAGLLPLQFGLFALIWTFWRLRDRKRPSPRSWEHSNLQAPISHRKYTIKKVWSWIGLMALISSVVFMPLGVSYLNDPTALGYVGQSSIMVKITSGQQTLSNHLLNSIRIFVDGPAGLWRGSGLRPGQLNQVLSFDWLALVALWIGLVVALKRLLHPAYLFLLLGFFVLWLPAPLNDIDFSDLRIPAMLPVHHAISNLRVAGVLPIYYAIVAIGLLTGIRWLGQKLSRLALKGSVTEPNSQAGFDHYRGSLVLNNPTVAALIAFSLMLVLSGGPNSYNFFVRWPKQPFLYERYNGPIFDLAQTLVRESRDNDILIPFQLYTHPTMHFFLDSYFTESDTPPLTASHDSAILITTSNSPLSAYMWLARSETGSGIAYLTTDQKRDELLQFSSGQVIQTFNLAAPLIITAQETLIPDMETVRPQLTAQPPVGQLNYIWPNKVGLVGYKLTPNRIKRGQSLNITLYWQNLIDQPLTHDVFIHAINSRGAGVGQVDGVELTDGHRWRAGKLTPTHHTLQLDDEISPGPYLIRLGLFNSRTGTRVPVLDAAGANLGDQVLFGLFYVMNDNRTPTQPAIPIRAMLGQQIQLLGYTLPTGQTLNRHQTEEIMVSPEIYWQTTQPVDGDYTIFVQLLNDQNEFITGYDTQPMNGNYPTSRWQTGEVVIEQIDLSLPADIATGDYRLVTGMYDFQAGQRLPAMDRQAQLLSDNMVVLAKVQVSLGQISFNPP
jgi:hypothetical protein